MGLFALQMHFNAERTHSLSLHDADGRSGVSLRRLPVRDWAVRAAWKILRDHGAVPEVRGLVLPVRASWDVRPQLSQGLGRNAVQRRRMRLYR